MVEPNVASVVDESDLTSNASLSILTSRPEVGPIVVFSQKEAATFAPVLISTELLSISTLLSVPVCLPTITSPPLVR